MRSKRESLVGKYARRWHIRSELAVDSFLLSRSLSLARQVPGCSLDFFTKCGYVMATRAERGQTRDRGSLTRLGNCSRFQWRRAAWTCVEGQESVLNLAAQPKSSLAWRRGQGNICLGFGTILFGAGWGDRRLRFRRCEHKLCELPLLLILYLTFNFSIDFDLSFFTLFA